jgi:hypothetical protein
MLRHLVTDISELQAIALERLTRWANPGTSIECALEILNALKTKLRYM